MKQKILVDSISEQRGFFSSVNLTLLTILWCVRNNIEPVIGHSVLSLYSSRLNKTRPFSEFFGVAYDRPVAKSSEKLEISFAHNKRLLSFDDADVIQDIRSINQELILGLTPKLNAFIHSPPDMSYPSFDISIHYRGCDYLKNTPIDHKPNLKPDAFITRIEKLISGRKFFVATDDDTFLNCLFEKSFNPVYFKEVYRKGPGRGSHIRSRLQRLGWPSLVSQKHKGFEVFRDCFWLSKSNYYIGSNSNLMYYSKLLNSQQVSHNINE
ncbi:MAG: hypothetical protein WCR08_08795 [Gammaproteobacteria bacterium]